MKIKFLFRRSPVGRIRCKKDSPASKQEAEDVIGWFDYLDGKGKEPDCEYFPQHKVVIMAGGKGTKLDPFTKIIPKSLIPQKDKPIIEHIMDRYHSRGDSISLLS